MLEFGFYSAAQRLQTPVCSSMSALDEVFPSWMKQDKEESLEVLL